MEDIVVGSVVKGKVTGVETYGIFVKINDEYSGLIHISEISDKFVRNVNSYAEIGETIYVEIKSVDKRNKRCILSIKDLNYRINDDSKVKETIRGFSPLKQHLPIWIEEKYREIHNENWIWFSFLVKW